MRHLPLKKLIAVNFGLIIASVYACSANAETPDTMEKCSSSTGDYSILLPKPVLNKTENDVAGIFTAKANGMAYVVMTVKKNDQWKEKTDESALADFIKGHQSEFTADEKKGGKVVHIEPMGDIKGKGWFGKLYSFTDGKIPGYWKYAVSKRWVYVITALNDQDMSTQTKNVLDSLIVADSEEPAAKTDKPLSTQRPETH